MRKVKFKKWIPVVYLDANGKEHNTFGNASKVNHNIKPFQAPKTKEGTKIWSDYTEDGIFHAFSTSGDSEGGIKPIAIIELEDKTVIYVAANNIKFQD